MESSNQVPKRSNVLNRQSEPHSSPYNYDENERIYGTAQPQLQERKIFGFQIFVDNDVLTQIGSSAEWFDRLTRLSGVELVRFNADLTIPDLNGRNIQIYDVDMEKKYQCARAMLGQVGQAYRRVKRESFGVIVFVPEGMVSLLIGTKGHQINKIMRESFTTIVVNQPINRMTYRTAKIQGQANDIAKACRIIYQILQQKSSIAYSIQKQPSQLDYTKAKVKTKLIWSEGVVGLLQRKKKALVRRAQQETKCGVRFESERDNRLLKKDQYVCVLVGRLQDVQAMLVVIINIAHDFLSDDKRNIDYTLRMLIPANYVTKLIGQKGYMIRDIIERSGGAQIKILSDKQSERDTKECIISINGSKMHKIDASCLILEQIECFKNGGPILQSGKSINENLAQQFKHSLPIRDTYEPDGSSHLPPTPPPHSVPSTPVTPLAPSIHAPVPLLELSSAWSQPIVPEVAPQILYMSTVEQVKNVIPQIVAKPISPINAGVNAGGNMEVPQFGVPQVRVPQVVVAEKQERSEEEGLIGEDEEEKEVLKPAVVEKVALKDKSRQKHSESHSRSRSRSRDKKKGKKAKRSSSSSSVQYKHDKEYVEVKLVVPRKLAQDHKELKYIESVCKSQISVNEQRIEGSMEAVLNIRGSLKENCQCLKLLQKRLARIRSTGSTTR